MTCETCQSEVHPLDMEVDYAGGGWTQKQTPLMVCPRCDRRIREARFDAWLDHWMPVALFIVIGCCLAASIMHIAGVLK